MKICFISNYFNHHQLDFCDELSRLLGDNFLFIQTEPIPPSRKQLGYEDLSSGKTYILSYKEVPQKAEQTIREANVIINTQALGNTYIREAQKGNQIIFWYMERLFKEANPLLWILKYLRTVSFLCFKKNKNQKFLCASSYCQKDIKALSPKLANFCYKWGYFPHIDVTKNRPLLKERKIRFLFVGRFLPWKHPEICLSTAKYLKKQNVDFEILIIGSGKLGDKLSTKIAKMGMERQVKILGSVKNSSMAEYYCKSDCFLFASGRKEGWGAVLNEAMAYGCVPIACAKAGSTKFLIENDKAGFTYSSKKEFFQDLDKVVEAKKTNKLQTFSDNAKAVIQQEWNGKNAARRLVEECNSLLGIKKKTAKTIGVMAKI